MTAEDNALGKSQSEKIDFSTGSEAIEFLTDRETLDFARQSLIDEKEKIALAVAFWGNGSVEALGVREWRAKNKRIICNATSGACNPLVLQKLNEIPNLELKTNPKLHAKIYISSRKAIISSANASASGLSLEGRETLHNIEAGVGVECPKILRNIHEWFEKIWNLEETVAVDENIIKKAESIWRRRRRDRNGDFQGKSWLKNKEFMKDRQIYVIKYEEDELSNEATEIKEDLKKNWANKNINVSECENMDLLYSIDVYEEYKSELKFYKWNSYIIDLTDGGSNFWWIPTEKMKKYARKHNTYIIPIFKLKQINISGVKIEINNNDIEFLQNKWKEKN